MDQSLPIILGLSSGIFMIIKIQFHKYLDKKNGYRVKSYITSAMHPYYIFPYFHKVSYETRKSKMICNSFWTLSIMSLVFFLLLRK